MEPFDLDGADMSMFSADGCAMGADSPSQTTSHRGGSAGRTSPSSSTFLDSIMPTSTLTRASSRDSSQESADEKQAAKRQRLIVTGVGHVAHQGNQFHEYMQNKLMRFGHLQHPFPDEWLPRIVNTQRQNMFAIQIPVATLLQVNKLVFKVDPLAQHYCHLFQMFMGVFQATKRFRLPNGQHNATMVLELVAHEDDAEEVVAYRFWVLCQEAVQLGQLILDWTEGNQQFCDKAKIDTDSIPTVARPDSFVVKQNTEVDPLISQGMWQPKGSRQPIHVTRCWWSIDQLWPCLSAVYFCDYTFRLAEIIHSVELGPENPLADIFHPPSKALRQLPHANATQSDWKAYTHMGRQLRFPFAHRCWVLTPKQFHLNHLASRILPSLTTPMSMEAALLNPTLCQFVGVLDALYTGVQVEAASQHERRARLSYEESLRMQVSLQVIPESTSLVHLAQHNRKERRRQNSHLNQLAEAWLQCEGVDGMFDASQYGDHLSTPELPADVWQRHVDQVQGCTLDEAQQYRRRYHAEQQTMLYQRQLRTFQQVLSVQNNTELSRFAPLYVQSLHQYLQTHDNRLQWVLPKCTSNLSLWGDYLNWFMHGLEHLFNASSCHLHILRVWFSILNSSDPDRKNKFHIMQVGPAAVSKSFTMKAGASLAVKGSVEFSDRESNLAGTQGGNHDYVTKMYDEAPPGQLGIASQGPGTKTRTERENRNKSSLTEGKSVISALDIDETTHKRNTVNYTTWTNQTKIYNTNDALESMSHEMPNRFFIGNFMDIRRQHHDILHVLSRRSNLIFDEAQTAFQETSRLFHALTVYVNMMIEAGNLPVVNTDWSKQVFTQILDLGGLLGGVSNHRQPRFFARLMAVVRAAVIQNAILRVFFSETSPFRGQPFRLEQMSAMIPELVDSDPAVPISVFGILSDQYFKPVQFHAIDAITRRCFLDDNDVRKIQRQQRMRSSSSSSSSSMDDDDMKDPTDLATFLNAFQTGASHSKIDRGELPADLVREYIEARCQEEDYVHFYQEAGVANPTYLYFPRLVDRPETPLYRKRERLTMLIMDVIEPKPDKGLVMACLMELEKMPIADDGNAMNVALVYRESGFCLSTKLVTSNRPNKLREITRHVLQQVGVAPGRYLFNMDMSRDPVLFETVDIVPAATWATHAHQDPLGLRQATSSSNQSANNSFARITNLNYISPAARQVLGLNTPTLERELKSSSAHSEDIVDTDLSDVVYFDNIHSNALNQLQLDQWGSNTATAFHEQAIQFARNEGRRLLHYPRDFKTGTTGQSRYMSHGMDHIKRLM
jgi:hypothetical protein